VPFAAGLNIVVVALALALTVARADQVKGQAHFVPTIVHRQRVGGINELLEGLISFETTVWFTLPGKDVLPSQSHSTAPAH
jgi:hypothetical protein